uniref:ATP synthase complex subunit 8 n=1 Tax=Ophiosteira antarctica TaxID=2053238 RepID=A0A3G2WJ18_9ECHI|nr:ATP synthase F0 subunit 8 [Ophiosteira antarctica]AYO99679.1 ATP synthase F0 subunit 8 [Ophiosteira antarctica]
MPQLDFTIWLINLLTSWLMFLLVFTTTNSISNIINLNSSNSNPNTFSNNNWTW